MTPSVTAPDDTNLSDVTAPINKHVNIQREKHNIHSQRAQFNAHNNSFWKITEPVQQKIVGIH